MIAILHPAFGHSPVTARHSLHALLAASLPG